MNENDQLDLFDSLPDWVNWLSQDSDSTWWGFEVEPLQHHQGWYENEVGRYIKLKKDEPNKHWQETLIKR